MLNMKLKVQERSTLSGLLPTQGDFTTISLIMEVKKRLALTEAEAEEVGYRVTPMGVNAQGQAMSRTRWNMEKDIGVEIHIGAIVTKIIVDALEELQKEKILEEDTHPLYAKFIKEKEALPPVEVSTPETVPAEKTPAE